MALAKSVVRTKYQLKMVLGVLHQLVNTEKELLQKELVNYAQISR